MERFYKSPPMFYQDSANGATNSELPIRQNPTLTITSMDEEWVHKTEENLGNIKNEASRITRIDDSRFIRMDDSQFIGMDDSHSKPTT